MPYRRTSTADFGLSFDHFGRSSSPQNHALTQHFYRRLDAAGLIAERDVEQVWSPTDSRFLPDRYVLGTCPHCRYEAARGDQCDDCGALLDPPELLGAALGHLRRPRPWSPDQPASLPAPISCSSTACAPGSIIATAGPPG